MGFVANFIRFPAVQTFEHRLRFDKVTDSYKVENFFETRCSVPAQETAKHRATFDVR